MFPNARTSLRRSNNEHYHQRHQGHPSSSSKTPIPIAVTLYNLMVVDPTVPFLQPSQQEPQQEPSPLLSSSSSSSSPKDWKEDERNSAGGLNQQQQQQQQILLSETSTTTANPSKWFVRPVPTLALLPPMTLDIVVVQNSIPTVVYSSTCPSSVHPTWDHLDERIQLPQSWCQLKTRQDQDMYKTMKFQFRRAVANEEQSTIAIPHHRPEDQDPCRPSPPGGLVILELPIHPTLLQRLVQMTIPPPTLPPNSCCIYFNDGSIRVSSSLFQCLVDSHVATIPRDVEDFSRFDESVFDTLDEPPRGGRRPQPAPSFRDDWTRQLHHDHENDTMDRTGYRDDNGTGGGGGGCRPRIYSASSLLVEQVQQEQARKQLQLQLQSQSQSQSQPNVSSSTQFTTNHSNGDSPPLDDDDDDNKNSSNANMTTTMTVPNLAAAEKQGASSSSSSSQNISKQISFEDTEQDITIQELQQEQIWLEKLIGQEEQALMEQDWQRIQDGKAHVSVMIQEAKTVQEEIQIISHEMKRQMELLQKEYVVQEAQRIQLIQELRRIYPITLVNYDNNNNDTNKNNSNNGNTNANTNPNTNPNTSIINNYDTAFPPTNRYHFIRDLKVPTDIVHNTTIPDEEVSAALGFLCHLVHMMSKYLSIPLRHRIFCNSSRSAIQQDGGHVFPMFCARVVERDQLETAVALLNANIDCLLKSRGIVYQLDDGNTHMLERLQRLYDHVIDGTEGTGSFHPVE